MEIKAFQATIIRSCHVNSPATAVATRDLSFMGIGFAAIPTQISLGAWCVAGVTRPAPSAFRPVYKAVLH